MVRFLVFICEAALYLYYAVMTYCILEFDAAGKIAAAVGMLVCADFVSAVVHECGHFIGGRLSGHRLISLQIGLLKYTRFKAGGGIRFSKWENQCLMAPDKRSPAFSLYQMGGVILNFLVSAAASYVGYFHMRHGSLPFLFCCALITAGIGKIAGNGIPMYKNGHPTNDMAFEKVLEKDDITRAEYYLYLWCSEAALNGEDISGVERPCAVRSAGYCDLFWRKIEELKDQCH